MDTLQFNNANKPSKSRKSVKLANTNKKMAIGRKKRRNSESIKKRTKTENYPINKPMKTKPKKRRNSTKPSSKKSISNRCEQSKYNSNQNGTRKSVKIGRPKRRHSIAANSVKSKQTKPKKSRKHSVSTICRKSSPKTMSKPTKPRKNKIIKKDDIKSAMNTTKPRKNKIVKKDEIISAMKSTTKKHKRSRSTKSISSQPQTSRPKDNKLNISYPYNYNGMKCQNIQEIGDALRRNEWEIGSNVLVSEKYYGRREWIQGIITNIGPNGQYLIITYLDRRHRKEHRFSKYLKVCWNDESVQELTQRVMSHFGVGDDEFTIGQYVQFEHEKLGKIWCQIMDIQRDELRMRYLQNMDGIVNEYKEVICTELDKVKDALSGNMAKKLEQRWMDLHNRFVEYSDRKIAKFKEQRCMHFNSMRELFSDCPNSHKHKVRIERMSKIIKSNVVGDIKLYPILALNFDNILSLQLVQFAINQKDEKKLKFVESFMYKSAELMYGIMDKFKGKVVIFTNNSYVRWHDLVMNMPAKCGGDWWRNLSLKLVKNEGKISLFSVRNVVSDEGNGCGATQTVWKEFLLSLQVDRFRKDRKKDIYYVPVVFTVDNGECTNEVNQAMNAVFGDYYRLIDYQCEQIQVRDGDVLGLLNEQIVIKSVMKLRDSSVIRPFVVKNCSDLMCFREKTWEGLFIGGHGRMLQKYFLNEDDIIN